MPDEIGTSHVDGVLGGPVISPAAHVIADPMSSGGSSSTAAMATITIQPLWHSAGEGRFRVTLAEPLTVARLQVAIHAYDDSHRTVPEQQHLTFAGRPLENISIYDGSVVDLDSVLELFVGSHHPGCWRGINLRQNTRASDTVASLKDKISVETGIPCDRFFLTNGPVARLQDNHTLHSYNTHHRECISVMPEDPEEGQLPAKWDCPLEWELPTPWDPSVDWEC